MREYSVPIFLWILLLGGLVVVNIQVYQAIFTPEELRVTVFTAGEGRAALLQHTGNKTLLINTGPDASILRSLGMTLPVWERSITTIVLPGWKASFSGGKPAIENRYHVKNYIEMGGKDFPYGAPFIFEKDTTFIVNSPESTSIFYGTDSLEISSTTPPKTYILK